MDAKTSANVASASTDKAPAAATLAKSQSTDSLDPGTPKKHKTTKEARVLCQILTGHIDKVPVASPGEKLVKANMERVAKIVTELIDSPAKIQPTEIHVDSADIMSFGSPRDKSQILDPSNTMFPEEVKTLADISPCWLWALLKKLAKYEISDGTIKAYSKKSQKNFRTAFTYLTGIISL